MPLLGKSKTSAVNPEIREVEKTVAREARTDQKSLDSAIGDLSKAGKVHNSSLQVVDKARHALDKSIQQEHKAAQALDRATHGHDVAVTNQQNAEKTVQMKKDHSDRMAQDLEQKRQRLEEIRQRKTQNDHLRESKLSEIHAREAAAADARTSFDQGRRASVGPGPTNTVPSAGNGAAGAAPFS